MFRKLNLDALGVTASILCAIHCAILPLVMASLPILGINILHNALFEYGMIALAFVIGTTALWHGFNRHHHRPIPWLLFTAGMSFLIAKEIWPNYELGLLPFAVLLVVGAHWLNYRWCRRHHRHRDFPDPATASGGNSLTLQLEHTENTTP
jgi:hypothetical protein